MVYLPTWLHWDQMRQRPQYLLEALAAHGHDVWFTDPGTATTERRGTVRIVPDLRRVPGRQPILYVHFAPARQAFAHFREPVVIYDLLDDLSIYDDGHVPAGERVATHHGPLIREADVVIASSQTLLERHLAERDDIVLVATGVDPERFGSAAGRPADLPAPDPARPLAGYHGAVDDWLDFDLVEQVAGRLPGWRFVLVGPVADRVRSRADRLAAMPNVDLLGERPSDDMPAYVQAFDVAAIWFRVDLLTKAVSPLKLYEALAAGTPVVSTALPVAVAEPAVRVATGAPAFAAALAEAHAGAADPAFAAQARATAAGASWRERVRPLLERLDELGKRRAP